MVEAIKRRSDRVLIALPVSVSGTDAAGKPFSEDTTTTTVSRYGGAIGMKTALLPGQEITIRRLRTSIPRVAECYVAGQIGQQADLQVYSVAFRQPATGFWDIYFPPLPADKDTAGRTVLGCKVCGTRSVVHLSPGELEVYNAHRQISRNCPQCGKPTVWLESEREAATRPRLRPANPERLAPLANNQRKHRRVAAEMPVCVRQAGADDDVASTVDISHGGLRFTSRRHYPRGSFVQVAVPYYPKAVNVFVDARITHSSKVPSEDLYQFGIMYLAENEPSL